jgi:hypothetical protein
MTTTTQLLRGLAAAGLLSGAVILPASAADTGAQARFRDDMAVCASGRSNQSPATCREEAEHAPRRPRRQQGDLPAERGAAL